MKDIELLKKLIIVSCIVFGILFKYRENPENFKKNVSIFGYKIKLHGKPAHNPFFQLLRAASF
jgi:hypothetical protein